MAIQARHEGPQDYAALLGLRSSDWLALARAVERGFPYAAVEQLCRNSGLAYERLLEWLQIASRTLIRRRQQGRFSPEESDRLLRAARIVGRAFDLFEADRDAAVEWMLDAQPALGGISPIDAAKTEVGAREVENLIGRLEHGVYS